MAEPGKINASFNVGDAKVTVEPHEHADDRSARLDNERKAARRADITYYISVACVVGFVLLSVYTIYFNDNAAPDTRDFTKDAFKMLASGVLSFFLGRNIGTK